MEITSVLCPIRASGVFIDVIGAPFYRPHRSYLEPIPPKPKASGNDDRDSYLATMSPISTSGAENAPTLENGTSAIIAQIRRFSQPNPSQIIQNRDQLIRKLYEQGISQADLGRQFGNSYQRIHQIVHQKSQEELSEAENQGHKKRRH